MRVIVTATSALNADNGNIISTNERPDCFLKEIFLITIYQKDINQICNITNKTQISAVMDEIIILYDISYGIDALYLYFLAKSKYVAFIKNTIKERKKLVQDIELFKYIIEQQFSCDKSIKENISHSLNKLISFIKNL